MHVKPMQLNMKLYDYIPANFNNVQNNTEMFGVEVELEGAGGFTKPGPEVSAYWTVHNDGSLRKINPGDECIEYVTKHPLNREDTLKAVMNLCSFLNQPLLKVYDSYRTSIHIHVNCLADTQLHVCNFITLCLLFDELFVSQNGDHRIGNNFCLRAKDAQGQIQELIKSIEYHNSIFGVNPNMRYSSVNFASLTKFGTVEFRSLECTTDPLRIMHWVRTIDNMKQACRTFENPQEIIRKFSQMSLEEFVVQVLGPQSSKYMKVPGYEEMLFNGMRLAQEFAFCSKWVQWKADDGPAKGAKKPAKAKGLYQPGQIDMGAYQQLLNAQVIAEPQHAQPQAPAPIDWGDFEEADEEANNIFDDDIDDNFDPMDDDF